MFGDDSEEEPTFEDPPEYIHSAEFKEWADTNHVHVDEKYGFL
jgi:hypothetical protein